MKQYSLEDFTDVYALKKGAPDHAFHGQKWNCPCCPQQGQAFILVPGHRAAVGAEAFIWAQVKNPKGGMTWCEIVVSCTRCQRIFLVEVGVGGFLFMFTKLKPKAEISVPAEMREHFTQWVATAYL